MNILDKRRVSKANTFRAMINRALFKSSSAPTESSPSKPWDAMQHIQEYLDTIGLQISSLGDDSYALQLVSSNHTMEELTPFYKSLYGWIVEMMKSLVSNAPVLEYLREQAHGGYLVDYKCFNVEYAGKMKRFIVTCKPASHVMKTTGFSEQLSRISPLVEEIAQLMRIYNLNLHPRLDIIVQDSIDVGIPRYKFFTEAFDYVPIYNVEAWRKAGKPKGASNHSIRIKTLDRAMQVASEEARWYTAKKSGKSIDEIDAEKALLESIGLSYTHSAMEDYNAISSFKASRLCRYLSALNRKEYKLAEKIIQEVFEVKTDFYTVVNGLMDVPTEDLESIGDITELSHSVSI